MDAGESGLVPRAQNNKRLCPLDRELSTFSLTFVLQITIRTVTLCLIGLTKWTKKNAAT